MLRLARLGRLMRMLRLVPEVLTLLKGIVRAMRPVFYVLLMLVGLLFVFAITFKTQSTGNEELVEMFPSIADTMGVLLLRGTLLDAPADTFYAVSAQSGSLAFLFLIFILLSSFTVLNMLIGILCDVVFEVTKLEKEEAALEILKRTMFGLLECYDRNADNRLGVEEFDLLMSNPETGQILRRFDVDAAGLRSLRDVLFEKKEEDKADEEKTITFVDFLEVTLRFRGGNSATVTDVMDLREFAKAHFESAASQLSEIRGDVRALGSQRGAEVKEAAEVKQDKVKEVKEVKELGSGEGTQGSEKLEASISELKASLLEVKTSMSQVKESTMELKESTNCRLDKLDLQLSSIHAMMSDLASAKTHEASRQRDAWDCEAQESTNGRLDKLDLQIKSMHAMMSDLAGADKKGSLRPIKRGSSKGSKLSNPIPSSPQSLESSENGEDPILPEVASSTDPGERRLSAPPLRPTSLVVPDVVDDNLSTSSIE